MYLKNIISSLLLTTIIGFLCTCCSAPQQQEKETKAIDDKIPVQNMNDVHSFAEPEKAVMEHLRLNLLVDFTKKTLKGTATVEFKNNNASSIFLDTKSLIIEKVTYRGRNINYQLHDEIEWLGQALEIDITPNMEEVTIHYQTDTGAEALGWLEPRHTQGKKHPFLLTQSQAILARTWVPCQDSPGIRFTYEANIEVPKELMALMSATNPQKKNNTGRYSFRMDQPIPAYLLALAVGDIQYKTIGKRTGVYADPAILNDAYNEFDELEKMVKVAESLYGDYAWERYDILVLPPSFPFGGMENPRLTFATPTIIAGDKSLVALVAHELAHSWSGNLTTNATWNDFWLNEGFTVYFENRIMEKMYGKDIADMLALISYMGLQDELKALNYGDDTKLKLNLKGRNPDDGVTAIAYEKGFFFLKMLEDIVGRKAWDTFLNQYFSDHRFKTSSTEEFLSYLDQHLLSKHPEAAEKARIDDWVYGVGLPDNCPKISSPKFEIASQQATLFNNGTAAKDLSTHKWVYQEWVKFISSLPDTLSQKQMKDLDQTFKFTKTGNNEVLFEWLMLSIKNNYAPAYPRLEEFLMDVGRRKFIAPLYSEMIKYPETKEMAYSIYKKAKDGYHFVSINTINQKLGL